MDLTLSKCYSPRAPTSINPKQTSKIRMVNFMDDDVIPMAWPKDLAMYSERMLTCMAHGVMYQEMMRYETDDVFNSWIDVTSA